MSISIWERPVGILHDDVIREIMSFLDDRACCNLRETHSRFASIDSALWTYVAAAVRETRQQHLEASCGGAVTGVLKALVGAVGAVVGVGASIGAVIYGGAIGVKVVAALTAGLAVHSTAFTAKHMKVAWGKASTPIEKGAIQRSVCEARKAVDDFVVVHHVSGGSDVVTVIERERCGTSGQFSGRELLPTDPPQFECTSFAVIPARTTTAPGGEADAVLVVPFVLLLGEEWTYAVPVESVHDDREATAAPTRWSRSPWKYGGLLFSSDLECGNDDAQMYSLVRHRLWRSQVVFNGF